MHHRQASLDETLRAIERRVFGDMWIGKTRRFAGTVCAAALIAVSVAGVVGAAHEGHRVALAAYVMGMVASLSSLAGLGIRRFGWICAATYACALATVTSLGAFWWYRTGDAGVPWPATFSWPIAGLLSAGWISVVVTPVERSQPDMRTHRLSGDRTS
ncbi:hypothetical protein ACN27E_15690 [Mycobacterium sp. WMMD1722]|uniref:hypothetical protein n=1 Tax=Mycobacterium sp. WMMD1722 TaxID=3404117 RepID=UPI003BF4D634